MEGAAKPSTSSGSGVTDGASGGAGAAAGASMEERFTDLCKVRMLTHLLRRLLLSVVGLGLFTATWVTAEFNPSPLPPGDLF